MEKRFGITGSALQWIILYFDERKQQVVINDVHSKEVLLTCNEPQGSVLGPEFFTSYESSLGDIIRARGLEAHYYADDTQLYLSFNPNNENNRTMYILADPNKMPTFRH